MAPATASAQASIARMLRPILVGFALAVAAADTCQAVAFKQTNLVASQPGVAPVQDANLKNPWGIAASATSPFWVANQLTGTSTIYDGTGAPASLVVTIPARGTPAGPTGLVFNPTSDFELNPGQRAFFIFATLDGTISGWNPAANPTSGVVKVDESGAGASFTGLALGNNGSGNFLYAADAAGARIVVYDAAFQPALLGFSFTDPNLPAGFTPYNIQNLGGTLYVTYENESAGGGIVNAFDLNGNLLRRVTANAAGGPLDGPWGLALAPPSFGPFAGALLVGNEGNGRISGFNPVTGQFLGQLLDALGSPIANPGLWGLIFGNGGSGGDPDVLYFVAGVADEREGLLGSISLVPGSGCVGNLSGRGTPAGRAPARIDLTWTALAGADRYAVFRGTASGGPYLQIGSTALSVFTDSAGLVSGGTYYYVLHPQTTLGSTICQSNEAKVTVPASR